MKNTWKYLKSAHMYRLLLHPERGSNDVMNTSRWAFRNQVEKYSKYIKVIQASRILQIFEIVYLCNAGVYFLCLSHVLGDPLVPDIMSHAIRLWNAEERRRWKFIKKFFRDYVIGNCIGWSKSDFFRIIYNECDPATEKSKFTSKANAYFNNCAHYIDKTQHWKFQTESCFSTATNFG